MRRIDQIFALFSKILLISYFVFVMISWLSYRELFRINSVLVSGTLTVDSEQVRLLANKFLSKKILWKIDRNNAVFYPRIDLPRALYLLDSHIKKVDIKIENKKILLIQIIEYSPANLWCGENNNTATSSASGCYLADVSGFIYAKAPTYSGYPFPTFYTNIAGNEEQGTPVGLHILPVEEFNKIFLMMAELEKNNITVSQIKQTDEHDYSFLTDKSWLLHWSSTEDPIKSVGNLELVLADIARSTHSSTTPVSIDLRFGNKIFYK